MNENIVVVYGSGASHASGYKVRVIEKKDRKNFVQPISPPTDKGFFKEIRDDFLEEEYPALNMFKHLIYGTNSCVGMEEVWTALDLNHKHISLGTFYWDKETQDYIDLIKKRKIKDKYPHSDWKVHNRKYKLTGDCGRDFRRLIYNIYSNYNEPDKRENRFKSLHDKILRAKNCRLLGYITFNYDCYLENAIKTDFLYVTVNNDNREAPKGHVPIIKLHGSLNWEQNSSYTDVIFHSPFYEKDKQVKPNYSSDNDYIQPAIIPPTIFKQEINDDSRLIEPLSRAILRQWRNAIAILQEADKILFVGYSFPDADFHSKRIFQISNMIRRRENDKQPVQILDCVGPKYSTKILFCMKSNGHEKRDLFKSIFGKDADIKTIYTFDKLLESKVLKEFLNT